MSRYGKSVNIVDEIESFYDLNMADPLSEDTKDLDDLVKKVSEDCLEDYAQSLIKRLDEKPGKHQLAVREMKKVSKR